MHYVTALRGCRCSCWSTQLLWRAERTELNWTLFAYNKRTCIYCKILSNITTTSLQLLCCRLSVPKALSAPRDAVDQASHLRHFPALHWRWLTSCCPLWPRHWPASTMRPRSHGGRGPRPAGRRAKPPSWWPLVKQRARLSATSGHYCWPVNEVKWTTGQKVSASVVDQSTVQQTRHLIDFEALLFPRFNSAYFY